MINLILTATITLFILLGSAPPVFSEPRESDAIRTIKSKAEQGDKEEQFSLGEKYYSGEDVPQDYNEAIRWLTKAAEQGHIKSQVFLGLMYAGGIGVTKDPKLAGEWFSKAAEQKDVGTLIEANIQMGIATMYEEGDGVPEDRNKAVIWYTKAAEQGYAKAQYRLGVLYSFDGTEGHKQAVYWLTKAAEQGHARAQYLLGELYDAGDGVAQDYKQAATWFAKAAEQGLSFAQYNIGVMYAKGQGVTQDYKQAVVWYTKAAEQGNAMAQNNLGYMYAEGKGVAQNDKLAYVWASLSAASGDAEALKNRDILSKRLPPQILSEAQELAARIQTKIDQRNHAPEIDTESPRETRGSGSTSDESLTVKGSGTGFVITRDGYILTCQHVVNGAGIIKVAANDVLYPAKVVREDKSNDLALLKINGNFTPLAFSPERTAKMGQEAFTLGFPNPDLQGVSPKLTRGEVSSLAGYQDDVRLFQISIPVQPGNSGGPLLDNNGNVIGVIVAMLNAATAFKYSGSLPQNVNYALKAPYVEALLDTIPEVANNLPKPKEKESFDTMIDRVMKGVVMIFTYE